MRGVVVAMIGLGLAQPALAADPGILRGSFAPAATYRNWEGFYVGGTVGVGGGGADLNSGASSLVDRMVAHTFWETNGVPGWATGGKADTGHAAQYGAFIGYNAQWDDVVLGLEATYHHTDLAANADGRTPPGANTYIQVLDGTGYSWPTAVSGGSWISFSDFGTIRARAGWAVDRFLPYVTAGVALGRASYGSNASVMWQRPIWVDTSNAEPATNPSPTGGSMSLSEQKTNALIYGWTAGLGLDVEVTQNIFLRAEYEFIQFSQMKLNLNSGRIGAGFKF